VTESPVVIVASANDLVARRLARALERRGHDALVLDGLSAARLFTIRVSGRESEVTPELPLFIRPSAWWTDLPRTEPDEQFAVAESYSALWSVAALSSRPVINRPNGGGWASDLTAGTLRPLIPASDDQELAEVCASGPRQAAIGASVPARLVLWGKNAEHLTGPVASLPEGTPLRARPADLSAQQEIITVVGDRAISATTDPRTLELALPERSAEIARQAGLHFAAVTWSVGPAVVPVRLSVQPTEAELRYSWAEVEDALCADLIA
jgi:hypothetical protein